MSDDMNNLDDLNQPIALRRGKRRSEAISPSKPSAADSSADTVPVTPSRTRSKKRVRFSDPGSLGVASSAATSGLTPFVGRATLNTPRRRASTSANHRAPPVEIQFTPYREVLDGRTKRRIRRSGLSAEMNDYESERKTKIQLEKALQAKDLELQKMKEELDVAKRANDPANRQTLEALSSSQRTIEAEIEDLRQSFNEANGPSGFDDDMDINWDAVNVHKAGTVPGPNSDGGDTIPIYEDDADMLEPTTPGRKNLNTTTTDAFDTAADEEILAMALDLESAKQEKRRLFQDLRAHIPISQPSNSNTSNTALHFEDSPGPSQQRNDSFAGSTTTLPSPPKTFYADLSKALKSTTHRAETAELALHNLEEDLHTLGFTPSESPSSSTTTILESIRTHFRQARLDLERVLPGETTTSLTSAPATFLPEAISKLKLLSQRVQERESELRTMHSQHRTLKSNFECSLRAAEKANQRIKELEDAVEEGADDLLNMRMKLQTAEKDAVDKEHTITSLIAALEKYRSDVSRLEALVVQLEHEQSFKLQDCREQNEQVMSDLEAKIAAEVIGRRKAEESAVERLSQIEGLQRELEKASDDAATLQVRLDVLEAQRMESEQLCKAAEQREQQHEVETQNLNTRLSTLSTALSATQAESSHLQTRVMKLEARMRVSKDANTQAADAMWLESVRSVTKLAEVRKSWVRGEKVRCANWEMEDEDEERENSGEGEPLTPLSLVRFVDVEREDHAGDQEDESVNGEGEVEGRVEMARGRARSRSRSGKLQRSRGLGIEMSMSLQNDMRTRRRLDSGIGMECLSEEDEDAETEMLSSDAVCPSSDSGFDIHEDAAEMVLPSAEIGMQE